MVATDPGTDPSHAERDAHSADADPATLAGWTFMTNHAHVLFCIAQDAGLRLRDVATQVGITERAVQRIVSDLHEAGFISVRKEGRRNRYEVHFDQQLRHPVERHRTVRELIALILPEAADHG